MTYESKYKDALDAINSGVLDLVDIKPYIPAIKKALAKIAVIIGVVRIVILAEQICVQKR